MKEVANHIYNESCECNICNHMRFQLVINLKDKLSRRNMQIKDLKKEIEKLKHAKVGISTLRII